MLINIAFDLADTLFNENFYFDEIDIAENISSNLTKQINNCKDPIVSFHKSEIYQFMLVLKKAISLANELKESPSKSTRRMQEHAKRIASEASQVILTEKQNRKKTNELYGKRIKKLSTQTDLARKETQLAREEAKKAKEEKEKCKLDSLKAEKEVIRNLTRKAGLSKQSPYEKAGTIKAVYRVIDEQLKKHPDLLENRGGKAALNRMILDLIANGDIPAPNTPSTKTVDSWIDNFKKS